MTTITADEIRRGMIIRRDGQNWLVYELVPLASDATYTEWVRIHAERFDEHGRQHLAIWQFVKTDQVTVTAAVGLPVVDYNLEAQFTGNGGHGVETAERDALRAKRDGKYQRTTYTFSVLSDERISEELELATIIERSNSGDLVMESLPDERRESLTGQQMADALYEAGSDPSFFNLDDDGNPVEI